MIQKSNKMTPAEEIKWLHSCRKSAQEIVDKITERINELQEKINEKSSAETKSKNFFQDWLKSQGYYRENGVGAWMKDNAVVSGKEINEKLNQYKQLNNKEL